MTFAKLAAEPAPVSFAQRHIGPDGDDVAAMVAATGAKSLDALIAETVPGSIRQSVPLDLGPGLSEPDAQAEMTRIARKNQVFTSLIGQGYSDTILPPVILRNILENPAWYTAYTPYQPEISQGRLEALINYQTMIADLTGLDIANASLLDEATAAAEAMAVAQRASKTGATAFFVDANVHPQTLAVLRTRAEPLGWTLVVGDPAKDLYADTVFGGILQYPASTGAIADISAPIAAIKAAGGIAVVAADLLALTVLTSPGELGADIAIGSAQRFGVPMGYGGPHAAYMAVKDPLKRIMPGRLVGVSIDARGERAYRLTLQTREQHIRREKATSNICTNQGLFAVRAAVYLSAMGPQGMREVAELCLQKAHYAKQQLAAAGISSRFDVPIFKEFVVRVPDGKVEDRLARAYEAGYFGGVPLGKWYPELADCMLVSVTEKRTREEIEGLAQALA